MRSAENRLWVDLADVKKLHYFQEISPLEAVPAPSFPARGLSVHGICTNPLPAPGPAGLCACCCGRSETETQPLPRAQLFSRSMAEREPRRPRVLSKAHDKRGSLTGPPRVSVPVKASGLLFFPACSLEFINTTRFGFFRAVSSSSFSCVGLKMFLF